MTFEPDFVALNQKPARPHRRCAHRDCARERRDHVRIPHLRQKAWSAGLIVLFFVAWELFCLMTRACRTWCCRGRRRCRRLLMKRFPVLWPHILQTLATTMIGFVLGVALGVVLGAVIGVSKTGLRHLLSAAGRLLLDPQGRGGADLRAVVRLRHGAGGADGAVDLLLSDRREHRDRPCDHRARTARTC